MCVPARGPGFLHGSELPVPLAAQQLQRHPQYETASGFPDEDFQCLPGILDPGGADDSACRVLVCVFLHHPVPVHDDGKREKYPSAGAPDTGKRVLRELGINVFFQVMIFLITWVLYLIFGTAVVAYAKLVKTPSTVVSTVIVYGDWVKSTMSLIGGAFGLVGSITYLYLILSVPPERATRRAGQRKSRARSWYAPSAVR